MAVVWQPDNRIRPSPHSPNAWDVDTGPLRAALAGWRTGRPTVAVWGPHGSRVTQQLDRLVWIMQDGSRVPIASAGPAQESTSAPNVLRVGHAVGGVEDVWEVQGNRLKHTWRVPQLTVPPGAVSLAMEGTLILQGVTLATSEGRSAGSIGLYHPSQASPVMEIARGEAVDDAEGARTHVAYEWYPSLREAANGAVVKDSRKIHIATLVDADWVRSLSGGFSIDPTISTSTSSAATAFPNQRKEDEFSNGTLFGMFYDGTNLLARYSTDGSTTWAAPSTGATIIGDAEGSCFIDEDNYIHVSASSLGGTLHYLRGTPTFDASNNLTGIAWSTPLVVSSSGYDKYSDLVAHREGTGWNAHVVWSFYNGSAGRVLYRKIGITSASVISLEGVQTIISGATDSTAHTYPSLGIDSSKNLYMTRTYASTGLGRGVRFRKAPYASGTWPWGTDEAVTESYYANNGFISSTPDSSGRVIVAFVQHSPAYLAVHERSTGGTWSNISPASVSAGALTTTTDSNDNVYVFYKYGGLYYLKRDRSGASWGSAVEVDATSSSYPSARRDTSGSAVDVLYTAGSSSPYAAKAYRLNLNQPPSKPTGLTRDNYDATQDAAFAWTHVDPDGNAQASRQVQIIRVDTGATVHDSGKVASSTQSMTLAGATLTNGLQYQWRVMTWDTADTASPWSDYATFYCSATGTPAITNPATDGATVTTSSITAQGTFSSPGGSGISAWQWWLTTPADGVLWTSGKVTSSSQPLYTVGYTLANTTSYKLKLQVWDGYGVASGVVERSFSVSFNPPATPSLVVVPIPESGYAQAQITNPAPSGSQVALSSNDLLRRVLGTATWTRIATGLPANFSYRDYTVASGVIYEYMARAVGENGVTVNSNTPAATLTLTGLWLHDVRDPQGTALCLKTTVRTGSWRPEGTLAKMAGRDLPVAVFGTSAEQAGQWDAIITNTEDSFDGVNPTFDQVNALAQRRATLCCRDGSGRRIFGVMMQGLAVRDETWGGRRVSINVDAVAYVEEV